MDGGDGDDRIRGGDATDTIDAGAGDNVVVSGRQYDEVDLGPGDDHLYRAGFDNVVCGSGPDTVHSSGGGIRGTMVGCERFVSDDPTTGGFFNAAGIYETGPDPDLAWASAGLRTGPAQAGGSLTSSGYGYAQTKRLTAGVDVRYDTVLGRLVLGRDGDDMITGTQAADHLEGEAGHDLLDGQAGADVLQGRTDDDDVIAVGGGRDTVDCGPGRDVLEVDPGDHVRRCERVERE